MLVYNACLSTIRDLASFEGPRVARGDLDSPVTMCYGREYRECLQFVLSMSLSEADQQTNGFDGSLLNGLK